MCTIPNAATHIILNYLLSFVYNTAIFFLNCTFFVFNNLLFSKLYAYMCCLSWVTYSINIWKRRQDNKNLDTAIPSQATGCWVQRSGPDPDYVICLSKSKLLTAQRAVCVCVCVYVRVCVRACVCCRAPHTVLNFASSFQPIPSWVENTPSPHPSHHYISLTLSLPLYFKQTKVSEI